MNRRENQIPPSPELPNRAPGPIEDGLKINGLQQVIDLLKFADPVFRESLLRRLTARDPKLAQNLRRIIK